MSKMLICPKCGTYQEDSTTQRKVGLGAKNLGKWVARTAIKFAAKEVGGTITDQLFAGGTGYVKRGIGKGVDQFMDDTSLKIESLDSVQYRCECCGHYWDGLDDISLFNDVQIQTIQAKHEEATSEKKEIYEEHKGMLYISIVVLVITEIVYSFRSISTVTNNVFLFGDIESQVYSWHYYVCWPLFVVFGIICFIKFNSTSSARDEYKVMESMTDEEYAKEYMEL